ncbi:MAG: 16S rRNA (cytosine(1402)-N(4))-methyltransferase RsmH [Parcubacteria group bacterium]
MHKSVLLQESVDALDLKEGEVYLDGTLGSGGHTAEVVRRFGSRVRVIGLDQDREALERSEKVLRNLLEDIYLKQANFKDLDKILEELKIDSVDAILLDLGFSSDQIEESGRGFSFQKDEPLDMRMSEEGFTAATILNSWDEDAIELILRGFGEEEHSKKIARAIVERRELKPFETTFDLVQTILEAKPKRFYSKTHPATKTFQALRITVNEELRNLEIGLEKGFQALKSGGRFSIISFHSLEDRIVKNFFRNLVQEESAKAITKKPLTASEEEVRDNPRSRSAKLRVIEKLK